MEHLPLDVLYKATVLLLISGGKKDKEMLQSEQKQSFPRHSFSIQWDEDSVITANLRETPESHLDLEAFRH